MTIPGLHEAQERYDHQLPTDLTTVPCDLCAEYTTLTEGREITPNGETLFLCPACYEWATENTTPDGDNE